MFITHFSTAQLQAASAMLRDFPPPPSPTKTRLSSDEEDPDDESYDDLMLTREHDQLPAVEEIRTNLRPYSQRVAPCSLPIIIVTAFLLAVIVGLGTLVGVVVKKTDKEENELEKTIKMLREYAADPSALDESHSPQRRAAEWMTFKSTVGTDSDLSFLSRYALMTLYYATEGETSWAYHLNFADPHKHHCEWNMPFRSFDAVTFNMGVDCNSRDEVTKIRIDGNGLRGTLPPEMSYFPNITILSLDGNGLEGELPSTLHKLTALRSFSVGYNSFEGKLPSWLGSLTNLWTLIFSNNGFHATIPPEIVNMTSLRALALDDNNLRGEISVFEEMPGLSKLYLEDNSFTGTLTNSLFEWFNNLTAIDLSDNMLLGNVPRSLLRLPSLRVIDLHGNQLTGTLPEDLPRTTTLEFLALHENTIQGNIPPTISRFSALKHLDLSSNRLNGELPGELSELSQLQYFFIANNTGLESGSIPESLRSLASTLRELSMKNTKRTGSIPDWIEELTALELLDLDHNELTGEVPSALTKLSNLKFLLLNRNPSLSGRLPEGLSDLENLKLLLLDNTDLKGHAGDLCDLSWDILIADCSFDCPCCTSCCSEDDEDCNGGALVASYDPIYEDRFIRDEYHFFEESQPIRAGDQ